MESPLSVFFRMHWDHEPETRKPFRIKASVFRFMESPHAIVCAHWEHERARGSSGAAVPAVFAGVSPAKNAGARRPSGRRDACPTTMRFMEREVEIVNS